MLTKKFLEQQKEILEEEKESLREQLKSFATEDPKLKGDWDTRFPKHSSGGSGDSAMEEAMDEVQEYATRLPLEHSLELKLRDVNTALEELKKGKYGICEKCKGKIEEKRLEAYPAARLCLKCQKK
ncbi:MAG: TraR/DksA C4-type zinc finger protein [Candidatus Parcubacteria bacterium]|nr:TraR/DksA C4-type zinc finger protein [Candidatus Parcubacteria bacterium]